MTTKIRIEWITLAPSGVTGGDTNDQPGTEYGVQELTATGGTAASSAAAPYFGLLNGAHLTAGVARISVIQGAAIVAAGVSPVPTETNGFRLVAGCDPQDIPVQSGWLVGIIEAADAPFVPGGGAVSDTAAEGSLATLVTTDGAAKADLDTLAAGQASGATQAHTDAGAASTLLTSVVTALGSENTALGGVNTALALLETHTDAVAGNTTLSAIQTALASLATHADETTANTALAAIQTAVGLNATHTDATATNAALATINTALGALATHADETTANTTLAAIQTALGLIATHADETTANTALAAIQTAVALNATHADALAIGADLTLAGGLVERKSPQTFSTAAGSPFVLTGAWVKVCTTTAATKGLRIAPIAPATTYDIEWVAVTAGAAAPADTYGEPIQGGEDFASGLPIGDVYLKSATGQTAIVRTGA
jgi:hypothetical protein